MSIFNIQKIFLADPPPQVICVDEKQPQQAEEKTEESTG